MTQPSPLTLRLENLQSGHGVFDLLHTALPYLASGGGACHFAA